MKKEKRFEQIYTEFTTGTTILLDKLTGVHYLLVTGHGITPLLDENGQVLIDLANSQERFRKE